MLTAHVTFGEIKRDVSFVKGEDGLQLRHRVMVAFSDGYLDTYNLNSIKLLKYDGNVPLPPHKKLKYDGSVPLPLHKKLKYDGNVLLPPHKKLTEDLNLNVIVSDDGPELPHKIVPNISYRFWHAATVTFLKRDPVNGAVSCIQDDDISASKYHSSTSTDFSLGFYRMCLNFTECGGGVRGKHPRHKQTRQTNCNHR